MTARWKQWVLNPDHKAVLSFSGGKDSTALYLLALEQGVDFLPVFADTGHEHELTYDYVRNISRLTGGPEVKWVRADFSAAFARKRMFIARDTRDKACRGVCAAAGECAGPAPRRRHRAAQHQHCSTPAGE